MAQVIPASVIQIDELISQFNLTESGDSDFFSEWQKNLPELDSWEKQALDRLKSGYLDTLKKPPVLENSVRMVLLYPLLFIAGFYISPLQVKAEQPVTIAQEEGKGLIIEGRLDVLVLKNQFWFLVIESKRPSISIEEGIPQILSYMLGTPQPDRPILGMLTNGAYFRFIKLVKQPISQYALSDTYVIYNQENELYEVLKILKRLANL